ncbi:hypothetical protein BOO22_16320 [Vibrio cidicii]|nr:hypothetical protein [Vibrio cidicii]
MDTFERFLLTAKLAEGAVIINSMLKINHDLALKSQHLYSLLRLCALSTKTFLLLTEFIFNDGHFIFYIKGSF